MPLAYADASALVKLIRREPETRPLQAFVTGADLVSCELVLTEVPRAVRRAAALDRSLPLDSLLQHADHILQGLALVPVDRPLLETAGAIAEPALRALDAIHVVAAASVSPVDAFLSYDVRQIDVAGRAGLPVVSPGA